jgi:hypothetical protein
MMQEGSTLRTKSGQVSSLEGQVAHPSQVRDEDCSKDGVLAPEAVKMLMELTEMKASFGPDPETAKVLADTERHAEEKKLEGYKATLEHRDRQSQRDQEFRMAQLKHSAADRRIVLFSALAALVGGAALSLKGDPQLGNPIMSAALTLLITLITGKLKVGD